MTEQVQTTQFRIGDWLVSPALDQISRAGETVKLEPRTMRLLLRLSEAPGEVVSSQQLLDDVWAGVVVSSQSVYQAISQLRKLLGDVDATPTYIATIPRKGYRLVALVEKAGRQVDALHGERRRNPSSSPASDSRILSVRLTAHQRILLGALTIVLIAALSYVWIERTRVVDTRKTSIVVMPFVDLTDGAKDAAFADGLTEEISTSLAQLPSLRVIARTSAYAVRDQKLDAEQIGRKLSATHIVEGTVRRAGDSVRVTAQLIDAARGHRGWSETYDLSTRDVLRLQSDIGKAVAQALDVRFSEQDSRRLRVRSPRSAEAYEMHLLARHYYRQRSAEGNGRAIELNKKAVALDPNFALAYVGLAQALLNGAILDGATVQSVAAEIERLAAAALAINPELAEAYALRGLLYRQLYDFDRARTDLIEAVRLDPSNVAALAGLGVLNEYEGKPREALGYYDRAAQLDPLDFIRHVRRCVCLSDMGEYRQAEIACAEARSLNDNSEWVYVAASGIARAQGQLANALIQNGAGLAETPGSIELLRLRLDDLENLGLLTEARSTIGRVRALQGDSAWAALSEAGVTLLEGKRDEAHRQILALNLGPGSSAVSLRHAASLLLLMDDPASAQRMIDLSDKAADATEASARSVGSLRWGFSHQVTLASAEKAQGDAQRAKRRMADLLKQLQVLEGNGVRGWGLHALRADALAIMDDADGAIRALEKADAMGWRRTYHVRRAPHFASVAAAPQLQALLDRMDRRRADERAALAGDGEGVR